MGRLIEAIGAKRFPAALAEVLRLAVPYSHTVIFGYLGAARPLDLSDDFPTGDRKVFVTDYLEGPYLLDPFYLASSRPMPLGLYRMHDLAPDRFYQGEYYHNYYAKTGLAEEIGFFIDIAPGENRTRVGTLWWEPHDPDVAEFFAYAEAQSTIPVAAIFKSATHTATRKAVYSVRIGDYTLNGHFAEVAVARRAGSEAWDERQKQV